MCDDSAVCIHSILSIIYRYYPAGIFNFSFFIKLNSLSVPSTELRSLWELAKKRETQKMYSSVLRYWEKVKVCTVEQEISRCLGLEHKQQ